LISAVVEKKFPDIAINASFHSEDGICVFFGPSGAGKSSIINMLAGLVKPDRGLISVNGRVLFDSDRGINLPPEKRGAGYVFQDSRLFPHMNARKNILYGTKGKTRSKISLEQAADLLGIEALLERYPHNLSGGEKQRIALARSLMSSPDFLLMDEPMASLDAPRRDELIGYISTVASEFKIPIVYVTHTVEEIIRLASSVGLMSEGKLIAFGPAVEIMNRPEMMSLIPERDFGVIWEGVVTESSHSSGIATVDFGGGEIEVAGALKKGARVRFRIPAIDVVISKDPSRTSARNLFLAKVKELYDHDHLEDIRLDINGATLWARITHISAEEMALASGDETYALVKSVVASQSLFEITV
jgi:molybdate transport system ATP-binding protein